MQVTRRATVFVDAALVSVGVSGLSTPLKLAATLFMMVLTAAAAQVSFPLPFTPVPFTFQPMVVLLAGAVLGPELGMLSQVLYSRRASRDCRYSRPRRICRRARRASSAPPAAIS